MNTIDEKFMREAILLAKEAADDDEAPIGAVIVRDGEIVGRGRNRREKDKNALGHAEIEAINDACKTLGGWRLIGCTMYVTLEPCPMCMGAIINSRMGEVVYGAKDAKAGACESVINMCAYPLNHKPKVTGGFMSEECAKLLSDFFTNKR